MGHGLGQALDRLDDGDAQVAGRGIAVELPGAGEDARGAGEAVGERPRVVVGRGHPQVEAAAGPRDGQADVLEGLTVTAEMSRTPNRLLGTRREDLPPSSLLLDPQTLRTPRRQSR